MALALVGGQALWKIGLGEVLKNPESNKIIGALTSLPIITGLVIYGLATALFMYVITKYKYGTSYTLIVAFSLIGATLVSSLYFHEKLLRVNLIGIVLILIGAILVIRR